MSATYSKKIFQRKNKLIKEINNLRQFIHKNDICFECEIQSSKHGQVSGFHFLILILKASKFSIVL